MKLLVIGGSRFLGRHIVAAALARGDSVTVFNRGRSGPSPEGVTVLLGDRRGDLSLLADTPAGPWDAVVDTCGYLPSEVDRAAAVLRARAGLYAFVSSVSVYAATALPNDESSPVGTLDDPETTTVDGATYGPLKALCEAAAQRHFGSAALILRPGLIVGPHDPTQRFTYWPARLGRARDGDVVLAPGRPDAAVQVIDARDLADFTLRLLDARLGGVFNAVGVPTTMHAVLQTCAEVAGVRPVWRWLPMESLRQQGLEAWSDLPLALPDDESHAGFMQTDVRRALDAGLQARPLAETVADTLAWWRALPPDQQVFKLAGLSPEREMSALAALSAAGASDQVA